MSNHICYSTAQRQPDIPMRPVGPAPKGDICSTPYEHACARWDPTRVEQSPPVTCACILKRPTLAVNYQSYNA